jgi:hypothetical protein
MTRRCLLFRWTCGLLLQVRSARISNVSNVASVASVASVDDRALSRQGPSPTPTPTLPPTLPLALASRRERAGSQSQDSVG